jgi:threonine/homoserine/homoserine lactone efflux protein
MRWITLRRWLYMLGAGVFLFQPTAGCSAAIQNAVSDGLRQAITSAIGFTVSIGVNRAFDL